MIVTENDFAKFATPQRCSSSLNRFFKFTRNCAKEFEQTSHEMDRADPFKVRKVIEHIVV